MTPSYRIRKQYVLSEFIETNAQSSEDAPQGSADHNP